MINALRNVIGEPPAGAEKYEYLLAGALLILVLYSCLKMIKWIRG